MCAHCLQLQPTKYLLMCWRVNGRCQVMELGRWLDQGAGTINLPDYQVGVGIKRQHYCQKRITSRGYNEESKDYVFILDLFDHINLARIFNQ